MVRFHKIKHVCSVPIPVFTGRETGRLVDFRVILTEFARNLHHIIPAGFNLILIRLRYGFRPDPSFMIQNEAPLNIVYTSSVFQPDADLLGDNFFSPAPALRSVMTTTGSHSNR